MWDSRNNFRNRIPGSHSVTVATGKETFYRASQSRVVSDYDMVLSHDDYCTVGLGTETNFSIWFRFHLNLIRYQLVNLDIQSVKSAFFFTLNSFSEENVILIHDVNCFDDVFLWFKITAYLLIFIHGYFVH